MRKHAISFLLGGACASAIFALAVLPQYRREKYEYGRYTGAIDVKFDLVQRIPELLGSDYAKTDGYKTVIEVKDCSLVVVERNGVKTLRTYTPGSR